MKAMPLINLERSRLLLIDHQQRLMPAIHDGAIIVENALKLAKSAAILGVPTLRTEQYPKGLGPTVPQLAGYGSVIEKLTFGSCATPGFLAGIAEDHLVVSGCEAHVCVLQTVFGLIEAGKSVFVVADAVGSRTPANKALALDRMARAGAEIVSTEMVIFEWLGTAGHPHFREVSRLIK